MYTALIGAATVRGFKSAAVSPVVSDEMGVGRARDCFMICFSCSVSYSIRFTLLGFVCPDFERHLETLKIFVQSLNRCCCFIRILPKLVTSSK